MWVASRWRERLLVGRGEAAKRFSLLNEAAHPLLSVSVAASAVVSLVWPCIPQQRMGITADENRGVESAWVAGEVGRFLNPASWRNRVETRI